MFRTVRLFPTLKEGLYFGFHCLQHQSVSLNVALEYHL